MGTITIDSGAMRTEPKTGLTTMERYMIRRFHPVSIFFDCVGLIWFVYFLWQHNWVAAAAVAVVERLASMAIVRGADVTALAGTKLGQLARLHLHPMNLMIQLVGLVGVVWGLWQHETLGILGGLSVVFLGHTFGWPRVDRAFSLNA